MSNDGTRETQRIWDDEAATFDEEPDHGLRDPVTRAAWRNCLREWLPATPSAVLDMGCGTGSLSVLMASLGHSVTGVDISPKMLALAEAKAKARSYSIPFQVADAANPFLAPRQFDVVVCRHLLWALHQPSAVLQRWTKLLKPSGSFVLIEGYWYTNAGLHAEEIVNAMPPFLTNVTVENLSEQTNLWGRVVIDERYVVQATLKSPAIQ